MMSKLRLYILRLFIPISKLISHLGKPEPRRTYGDYAAIAEIIRPGDVLLSREDWRLSNLLIPGFWSHAAIYIGDNVLEAVPPRVRTQALAEWVLSVDSVAVLRPTLPIEFGDYSNLYMGADYDWIFADDGAWFCSELVRDYLSRCGLVMSKLKTPQDFFNKRDEFKLLYEAR